MNSINSSSLCHFTKEMATLKAIISKGLRFSYALEKHPLEIIRSGLIPFCPESLNETIGHYVAIPMISFCDIPITRANEHIAHYGRYMIGFNKKNLASVYENVLNPVIYTNSPNLRDAIIFLSHQKDKASKELLDTCISEKVKKMFENMDIKDVQRMTSFQKLVDPAINFRFYVNFLLGLIKPVKDKDRYYYDEREWRAFKVDNADIRTDWHWGITEEEFNENVNMWNENIELSKDGFITIPPECIDEYISHIVVAREDEKDEIIDFIMENDTLFGYENDFDYTRLKLISKLSSMEQIENDF